MSENLEINNKFEQLEASYETERKFVPNNPELFEQYRGYAEKEITQVYLSNPSDEYSLRLRQSVEDGKTSYSATLKDRGDITPDGLRRPKVEIPINKETYDFYSQSSEAVLHKTRAEPLPGVTVDWIEGLPVPIIEIENVGYNEEASNLLALMQADMREVTESGVANNESLAYTLNHLDYPPAPNLEIETILGDIEAFKKMGKKNIVLSLAGRSGSGKTTITRSVAEALAEQYGAAPIVISTDDYHRGKHYLERTYGAPWTNWDVGEVYDTAELARDIERLQRHEVVQSRSFDFATQEPLRGRSHDPNPIIIIEGIHAGTSDLAKVRDIHFEIPTTFATSLGRDIGRLLQKDRSNESIGTPEDRLKYMLEVGEPTYRTFERPRRNRFSSSVRPLGSTAIGGAM